MDPVVGCCRPGTCRADIARVRPERASRRRPRLRRPLPEEAPAPPTRDPTRCRNDEACLARQAASLRERGRVRQASQIYRYLADRDPEPSRHPRDEYRARGLYLFAEAARENDLENLSIDPGVQATVQAFVNELTDQVDEAAERTNTVVHRYDPVVASRRSDWVIAAFVRQGQAFEVLALAVLDSGISLPRDLRRRLRGTSQTVRDEVQVVFEDRVREVLDEQVRPMECYAVGRYVLAVRAAQAGQRASPRAMEALVRLEAYGDERIRTCVEQARRSDSSFASFSGLDEFVPFHRVTCEGGEVDGCVRLAVDYLLGRGDVDRDARRGQRLLQRYCRADHAFACVTLGRALLRGGGLPPDREAGLRVLQNACDRGVEDACRLAARERRRTD